MLHFAPSWALSSGLKVGHLFAWKPVLGLNLPPISEDGRPRASVSGVAVDLFYWGWWQIPFVLRVHCQVSPGRCQPLLGGLAVKLARGCSNASFSRLIEAGRLILHGDRELSLASLFCGYSNLLLTCTGLLLRFHLRAFVLPRRMSDLACFIVFLLV